MLSAFDLDDTLIQGNTSARFCQFLRQKRVLSASVFWHSVVYGLRHRFFGMSLADLHHRVFNKILRGKPLALLEKYLDEFVQEMCGRFLYIPAVARLKRAQQLGHYTMILSTSPSFLVKHFAKALGVNAYFATEYDIDAERKFNKIRRIFEGKDKAAQLIKIAKKLGIFIEEISAYTDSILDLELLQVVGNPIAVNPDKKLRAISVKNQWSII